MALAINTAKIKAFFRVASGKSRRRLEAFLAPPAARRYVSPLLLRILAVNVMALAILVGSLLYLGRYQDRLIASELDALSLQARLSAGALGEGAVILDEEERNFLSPVLSRLMIRRLIETQNTRTRLFGLDNNLLADSLLLQGHGGRIQKKVLRQAGDAPSLPGRLVRIFFDFADHLAEQHSYPPYAEEMRNKAPYEIVRRAMGGETASQIWAMPEGGMLLSVAVPVQRYKQVLGVLMLSRPDTAIDQAVQEVRLNILKIFAVTLFITTLLSLYLARAIATPIRLLASAADSLRHGQKQIVGLGGTARLLKKEAIPDFSYRHDEIGDLSSALRDMTSALAERIDAIEHFAADVAHEIKNPLTSLRSAVETAEKVQDPAMQRKLMMVIRDDVDRLDRLISDISNASRLDAELSRDEAAYVEMGLLIETLVDFHGVPDDGEPTAAVVCGAVAPDLYVLGVEVRLMQVLQNLVSNALSFAPSGTQVVLSARAVPGGVIVTVEDEGPGIPENKLADIFDRFYSERPKSEKFGTHSGLGLSISKQIVDAHRGHIWAENRLSPDGRVVGARFVVALPAAKPA